MSKRTTVLLPLLVLFWQSVVGVEAHAADTRTGSLQFAQIDMRILLAQAPVQAPAVREPRRPTTCPAAPSRVLRSTPECGVGQKGEPRFGLFQCSLRLDAQRGTCEEDCRFVVCRTP
jgi:hypothetical protein